MRGIKTKKGIALFIFALSLSLGAMDGEAIELYNAGEKAMARQDYYGAIDSLQDALRLNPAYLDAILSLADAYFRIEEYEEAYDYVEKAALYGRNDRDLINMKARILIGREDLDEAEALFRQVLGEEPNNLEANLGMAEISLLRGDRDRGVEGYTKSLILAPESRRALLSLALLYDREGLYNEAENYLELALAYHSRDGEVYISLAEHYLRTGDVDRAAYYASGGTQLAPDMTGPYRLLGQAYMEQNKWLEAMDPLIQALSREPRNVTTLYMLSQCYIHLSMDDAALKTLDKALRIDPYNEIVRITMEQFLINNPGTAVAQRVDLGNYHFEQGLKWEERYYFDRAYDEYRRARWINPYDYEGWILYGKIFNKQGFPSKYLNTMQAARESGYDDASFLETLKILEHRKDKGLDDRWGFDQFDLAGNPYDISLFPRFSSSLIHTGSEQILGDYLKFNLLGSSLLNPMTGDNIRTFSQAYSQAREQGSDYFIILDFSETERTFLIRSSLYLSGTGAKIGESTVMRTGKGRISLAMAKMGEDLNSFFIPRTLVVDLNGDDLLLAMGRVQGIEEEQTGLLIKKDGVSLLSREPWIEYNDDDLLGHVTIIETDEEISRATVDRFALFDLINPGDEIYFIPDDVKNDDSLPVENEETIVTEEPRRIDDELKSQLLRLN